MSDEMSSTRRARRVKDPWDDIVLCPFCEHMCKRGLYTVQMGAHGQRSVCAGCWVSAAMDPPEGVIAHTA
jgi:transcription elongation factor Elf1